MSQRAGDEMR